jgi:hypothetical protein
MARTLHGTVHGRTIELAEDIGVAEGQEVEIEIRIVGAKKRAPGPPPGWQPGRHSATAGLLAESWTIEDDRILDEIYRDRCTSPRLK